MRTVLAVIVLLTAAAWSTEKQPPRGDESERSLTAEQLQHYTGPYYPEIRACYLQHAPPSATGELRLMFTVGRDGYVMELHIAAPGVTGKHLDALTTCIAENVRTWHFPSRRDFTKAELPYLFRPLHQPGAVL